MVKVDDIVVVGATRTPMGNFGGTLKDFKCYDLGMEVIRGVLKKSNVSAEQIDYVVGGNTRQAGNGPNPARTAALKAGIGIDVHAITINNACPSSMKAAIVATQNIRLCESDMVLVLGMESMSTIPFLIHGIRWSGIRFGDHVISDGWGDACDNCPFHSNSDQSDSDENGIGNACEDSKGDVNGDEDINVSDVQKIINFILEVPPPPTDEEFWAADCNDDYDITVSDAQLAINKILGVY